MRRELEDLPPSGAVKGTKLLKKAWTDVNHAVGMGQVDTGS